MYIIPTIVNLQGMDVDPEEPGDHVQIEDLESLRGVAVGDLCVQPTPSVS